MSAKYQNINCKKCNRAVTILLNGAKPYNNRKDSPAYHPYICSECLT